MSYFFIDTPSVYFTASLMEATLSRIPAKTGNSAAPKSKAIIPAYDMIIIGGGITGGSILREASLRGLHALLLEKKDFASGTTQATSRLIHGGLRYLKQGRLGLVRESLRERRNLARFAPHAVKPAKFIFSLNEGQTSPWQIKVGLWLYDLLGMDRNLGLKKSLKLPRHKKLKLAALPEELKARGAKLTASFCYYDYANLNPERLCVELIEDACLRGCEALNYSSVMHIVKQDTKQIVHAIDEITGQPFQASSPIIINAAGPWADLIEDKLARRPSESIVRSRGVHIVTRGIAPQDVYLAFQKKDGKHFFILPWRGCSMIGTTDTSYAGAPDAFAVQESDIKELLETANQVWPQGNLKRSDVLYYFGGMRPLLAGEGESGESTYEKSRKSEILKPAPHEFPGFYTVLGGKYTTSRALAEELLDRVSAENRLRTGRQSSSLSALPGGRPFDKSALIKKYEGLYKRPALEELLGRYGALSVEILALDVPPQVFAGCNGEMYTACEFIYHMRYSHAKKLSDLYLRRTGLGTTGLPHSSVNRAIADLVAAEAGWDKKRREKELAELKTHYELCR